VKVLLGAEAGDAAHHQAGLQAVPREHVDQASARKRPFARSRSPW
jgi:hypothetical protein